MSGAQTRFTLVDEAPAPAADKAAAAGMQMVVLGLHTLSQRALTAISDLFTLILVASVCFLARTVLDSPSREQIVLVFGYAFFCLAVDAARRRRK